MSNEEVARAFHEVYNGFWLRFRNCGAGPSEADLWQRIWEEGQRLIEKYSENELVAHMVTDLLLELSERARSGPGRRG